MQNVDEMQTCAPLPAVKLWLSLAAQTDCLKAVPWQDQHPPLRLHVLVSIALALRAAAELAHRAACRKRAGPCPGIVAPSLWRAHCGLLAVAILVEAAHAHVQAGHVLARQQATARRQQGISRAAAVVAAARAAPLLQQLLPLPWQAFLLLACRCLALAPLCRMKG